MMIKNLVFDLGGVIVPLNRVACIRAFNDIVGYKDFENLPPDRLFREIRDRTDICAAVPADYTDSFGHYQGR